MTTKRDKYLKWKHELLNRCGQCMGFRAKGIDLSKSNSNHDCAPGADCHKTCPALGMGAPKKRNEDKKTTLFSPKKTIETTQQPGSGILREGQKQKGKKTAPVQQCFNCGKNEEEAALLPCRYQGKSIWVCTKCLPQLIHG